MREEEEREGSVLRGLDRCMHTLIHRHASCSPSGPHASGLLSQYMPARPMQHTTRGCPHARLLSPCMVSPPCTPARHMHGVASMHACSAHAWRPSMHACSAHAWRASMHACSAHAVRSRMRPPCINSAGPCVRIALPALDPCSAPQGGAPMHGTPRHFCWPSTQPSTQNADPPRALRLRPLLYLHWLPPSRYPHNGRPSLTPALYACL